MIDPNFLLQIFLAICAGAGVYAAIRVDLVSAKISAQQAAESAKEAHGRIDLHINYHMEKGSKNGN